MAKATEPQDFADGQLKERPHKTTSPHVPVGTYTQQAKCPKTGPLSQSLRGMLCPHLTREEALGVSPSAEHRQCQLDIPTHWRMVNKGAAADTAQAPVLCAFNTFSFPLCSLNKKKLFCRATFCSFLFSLFFFIMFLISSLKRNSLNLCLPIQFDAF